LILIYKSSFIVILSQKELFGLEFIKNGFFSVLVFFRNIKFLSKSVLSIEISHGFGPLREERGWNGGNKLVFPLISSIDDPIDIYQVRMQLSFRPKRLCVFFANIHGIKGVIFYLIRRFLLTFRHLGSTLRLGHYFGTLSTKIHT
jgi:hypothetical protein